MDNKVSSSDETESNHSPKTEKNGLLGAENVDLKPKATSQKPLEWHLNGILPGSGTCYRWKLIEWRYVSYTGQHAPWWQHLVCVLPKSECAFWMDMTGCSLPSMFFPLLWIRLSQRNKWRSFTASASKGTSKVQKDLLQCTSDCAEIIDTENSAESVRDFGSFPFTLKWSLCSVTLCYQLRWQ